MFLPDQLLSQDVYPKAVSSFCPDAWLVFQKYTSWPFVTVKLNNKRHVWITRATANPAENGRRAGLQPNPKKKLKLQQKLKLPGS